MKRTALAQLVELYAECRGVTTTAELAKLTGYSERAIWKAKAELRCTEQEFTLNHSSVNQSAETCTIVQVSSRAHKLPEEIKKTPIIPKLELEPPPADKPKAARKLADMVGFDDWYSIYPKKTGKAAAERAWPKAVQRAGSPEPIIEALKKQLPSLKTKDRQYIKDPSTWLNKACWEDEIGLKNGYTPSDFEGKSRSEIMRMMRAH